MKTVLQVFLILLVTICTLPSSLSAETARSTRPATVQKNKVEIDLISNVQSVKPGKPFWVALRQRIEPHWHTYWKNPGDSGEPTHIKWELPAGYSASDIHWPIPDVIPVGTLINYGYSDEVLLLTRITPPAEVSDAPVDILAKASWLVCEKICIPEQGQASLQLNGLATPTEPAPLAHASLVDRALRALPRASPWSTQVDVAKDRLKLTVEESKLKAGNVKSVGFFPDRWGQLNISAAQVLEWHNGTPSLILQRGELKDEKLEKLTGLLVIEESLAQGNVRHGFLVSANARPVANIGAPKTQTSMGLWQALLFAFLGGAILNLMPCVFPVLSLKALTLAQHGEGEMAARKRHGLYYLTGVLVSFLVFAAILIALRAAGETLGWGFQFQSPMFVLAMAALFFAIGLSLSGVFSIGGNVIGLGQSLTEKAGPSGSFFTGALASLAATPCTAPFMGAAMGFALTQPAMTTFFVFLALGLGFAVPMLALSYSSRLARVLPKPGPWMETLKQVLAFPLYATVAWLVWVLSVQAGSSGVLAAAIVLIAVGFVAWLLGAPKRGTGLASLASVALLVLAGVVSYQLVDQGHARQATNQTAIASDPLAEPFSKAALEKYLDEGRTVFVNFTAAWCITCKVNELVALSSKGFKKALGDHDVVYLKGDWTNGDSEITSMLKEHGRAGVPLYLLFRGSKDKPVVFPQILTEAMVVDRLVESSKSAKATSKSGNN